VFCFPESRATHAVLQKDVPKLNNSCFGYITKPADPQKDVPKLNNSCFGYITKSANLQKDVPKLTILVSGTLPSARY
jgi:ribosomal protein S17E